MTNRTGLKLEEDVATTSQVLNAAEGILSEAFGGQVKLASERDGGERSLPLFAYLSHSAL